MGTSNITKLMGRICKLTCGPFETRSGTRFASGELVRVVGQGKGLVVIETRDGRTARIDPSALQLLGEPCRRVRPPSKRAIAKLRDALSSARLENCALAGEHQQAFRPYLESWVAGRIEAALDEMTAGTVYDPEPWPELQGMTLHPSPAPAGKPAARGLRRWRYPLCESM